MSGDQKIDPIDAHAGMRLRLRRVKLGLSQAQVAKVMGCQFQQIYKMEQGTTRLSAGKIWKLAEYLDVEPGYFFEGAGERLGKGRRDPVHELTPRDVTETSLRLLKVFADLKPARQASLLQLAESMQEANGDAVP